MLPTCFYVEIGAPQGTRTPNLRIRLILCNFNIYNNP
nr:MAG TPA: hypothetical protein [Caudoviricetes sp.]